MLELVSRGEAFGGIDDVTFVRGHADIDHVLRSQTFVPLKGDEPVAGRPFITGTMAAAAGSEHIAKRRLFAPLFTSEMLHYFQDHGSRPVITETLLEVADRTADGDTPEGDLVPIGIVLVHRIAAQIVGFDGVVGEDAVARFNSVVDRIGKGLTVEFFHDPEHVIPAEARAAQDQLREEFFAASLARRQDLVAAYRAGRIEKAELPRDIITFWLLDDRYNDDLDALVVEIGVFLNASTRTTGRSIPHIVHHIAQWVAEHPEDRDKTTSSDFLRGAISESLRLHAVLPAITRRATERTVLPSGNVLEAGEKVALILQAANLDTEIYGEDAHEFNPYRIDTLPKKIAPWALSFGAGAHTCIGRRLVTGGDWRRESTASDKDLDGSIVAIMRALYEAGVRPHPDKPPRFYDGFTDYDEYASYPVVFETLGAFADAARASV